MAELEERNRKYVARKNFAYVDAAGEGHLPIHDEAHARNALARFNQTEFESEAAKERARRKILAAARKFGIDVSPKDKVKKTTRSLSPARTKRGPRGGRRTVSRGTRTRRAGSARDGRTRRKPRARSS
jgi:hypothetical protein